MADRNKIEAAINVLPTKVQTSHPRFEKNMREMARLVTEVRNQEQQIAEGGGSKAIPWRAGQKRRRSPALGSAGNASLAGAANLIPSSTRVWRCSPPCSQECFWRRDLGAVTAIALFGNVAPPRRPVNSDAPLRGQQSVIFLRTGLQVSAATRKPSNIDNRPGAAPTLGV